MIRLFFATAVSVLILRQNVCDGLTCFSCAGITDVTNCTHITTCQSNEACYLQTRRTQGHLEMDLGCQDSQLCGSHPTGASLVGRSYGHYETRQTSPDCHECCTKDSCNINLCAHHKPSACVDDPSVDCAHMNTLWSICSDIDHSKTICPRFCGFCSVVDGEWTTWSSWSSCDVTCSFGTQVRVRTCTNPAPANGGSDCVGVTRETKNCTKQPCPVHGGWSLWSPWGACSVSCDVGIQRRDRSCSNPYPDLNGDHCFGESRDDRICMTQSCSDGGWSSWHAWEGCSVSCGGGVRRRHRLCDNPAPSTFGRACIGTDEQTEICNNIQCKDGGWSSWRAWEGCSVSCGGGVRRRHRLCNNPTPSTFGRACIGSDVDMNVCNIKQCKAEAVGFHVNHVRTLSSSEVIFDRVLLNDGRGYSSATGYFTAPSDGLYLFTASMCVYNAKQIQHSIVKVTGSHQTVLSSIETDVKESQDDCNLTAALTRLVAGDRVAVKCTFNCALANIYQSSGEISTFTGTKIAS